MRLALIHDLPERINKNKQASCIYKHHNEVAHNIKVALEGLGHEVVTCISDENLEDNLRKIDPQFAFNLSVRMNDDSEVAFAPFQLEKMEIPFTGSSAKDCANAFDKFKAKKILEKAKILTPKAIVINKSEDFRIPKSLAFPLFVKPVRGGCSKGIRKENLITGRNSYVEKIKKIFQRINEPILVEEYLPGREFSVGIIGNKHPHVLPIEEFQNANGKSEIPFRNFSKKMINFDEESITCPANLLPKKQRVIEELAVQAYKCLGCRDYSRIDIRLNQEGTPNILDINVLPSLIPEESSFVLMAQEAGISFINLIRMILILACHRNKISYKFMANNIAFDS